MGDRCIITDRRRTVGLYLHDFGDRSYVLALLRYASMKGLRPCFDGKWYGSSLAALAAFVSNFNSSRHGFAGDGEVKILTHFQNPGDNGIYILTNEKWEIETQELLKGCEEPYEPDEEEILDNLISINTAQPEKERLSSRALKAEYVPCNSEHLRDDDEILVKTTYGIKVATILGFGGTDWVYGFNVDGKPYTDALYREQADKESWDYFDLCLNARNNVNSYVLKDKVWLIKKEVVIG